MKTNLKSPPSLQGTSFNEEEKELARKNKRLLFVSLNSPPYCNLRCIDCYVGDIRFNKDELLLPYERRDVLKQAKELGAKTLRIAGEGEPMVWTEDHGPEEFYQTVEYVTGELDMDMFFFTNGTKLYPKGLEYVGVMDTLKNPKISLATKFWGTPEVMQKLTGNKTYFDEDMFTEHDGLLIPKSLKKLIELELNKPDKDGNSRLGIEFLLRKSNYGYAFDIFRWARRNNIIPYFEQNLEAGRALLWKNYRHERVSDADAFALSKRLLEIDETEFGYTWLPSIPYLAGGICENEMSGCRKYTYNIVISSTGDAYPCYAAHFNLGNIREKSLKEILNHPIRLELLRNPIYNCLCRVYNRSRHASGEIKSLDDLNRRFDYENLY